MLMHWSPDSLPGLAGGRVLVLFGRKFLTPALFAGQPLTCVGQVSGLSCQGPIDLQDVHLRRIHY